MCRSRTILLCVLFVVTLFWLCEPPIQFSSSGENWGIYELDLQSEEVNLLYGSEYEISGLSRDLAGKRLVFSQHVDGSEYENTEIYTLDLSTLNRQD